MDELTLSEMARQLGRKGGQIVNQKYGQAFFSKIGKIGMASRWKNHLKGRKAAKKS